MLYPPNLIMWLDVICRKYHTIHYKSKGGSPALLLSSSSFMLSQIVISLAPGTRHISHFFLRNAGNNISREQKYGVTMSYTEWGGSQNTYEIKKYKSLHFSLDLDISWIDICPNVLKHSVTMYLHIYLQKLCFLNAPLKPAIVHWVLGAGPSL